MPFFAIHRKVNAYLHAVCVLKLCVLDDGVLDITLHDRLP
jgi:hypothetical protein